MMAAPITPAFIAAASAGPTVDLAALERAFAAYPGGEGLSGFADADAMLSAFTDGVCVHLVGDFNPLPDATVDACRDYAATYHGTLFGFAYRDGAAMAVANWHGFRECFAADLAAAA